MTGIDKELFHKLFETLRAEDEGELFDFCYLSPDSFEQIVGSRSCIVFGETGSGKTALYRAILNQCNKKSEDHRILTVNWSPKSLPPAEEKMEVWVSEQIKVLLDVCAVKIIEDLVQHPDQSSLAPDWVKARIGWFIQNYVLGDASLRLGPILETDSANSIFKMLQKISTEGLFYEKPSPELAVKELLLGLKFFKTDGIWVIADDIQEWTATGVTGMNASLVAFLSMLSIFENTGLVFKFILPNNFEASIAHASGLVRRRVDKYMLTWDTGLLKKMVERRLAFIMKKESFQLVQLCNDPDFENWLLYFGGDEPRQWLELLTPFIKYYIENGLRKPIESKISKELRLKNPPRFHLDEKDFRVKIGGRIIPLNDLPRKVYSLLTFLYRHAGEVVTKEKLYYAVDHEITSVPARGDDNYVDPIVYTGQIDTNIYRLRQAIEPDPKNPVILQTERGYGVRLAVKW